MINRECGVFKTSYTTDAALFPLPLTRLAMASILAFFVVIVPLFSSDYVLNLANFVFIASVGAIGLNILLGYTGQISLAHGAFMSVGAYTAAKMITVFNWPFWLGLPAAGLVAAGVGAFFGIPSLRIKGLYLAIATLAAQFIIEWLIVHITWISGGAHASVVIPKPVFGPLVLTSQTDFYYFNLIVLAIAVVVAMNLFRSGVGRAFIAIRDRDIAAGILGINVFRYKLLAFAVSSFYAGVTGAMYAYFYGNANYEQFDITVSIDFLAMVIIGGMGSILGSIFGAIFITVMPVVIRLFIEGVVGAFISLGGITILISYTRYIVFGLFIIGFLILEPEGLNRLWKNIKNYFRVWPFGY